MSLPPVDIPLGAMRFNSDSQKLEYFNGLEWLQIHTFSPDLNGGARGLYMGGYSWTDTIDYWTIPSSGNAIDFGNLIGNTYSLQVGTVASNVRGFNAGSAPNPGSDTIEYVTFSQLGNSTDFGYLNN